VVRRTTLPSSLVEGNAASNYPFAACPTFDLT
jgi:hypothetical protein